MTRTPLAASGVLLSLALLAVVGAARAQGASASNDAEVRRFVVAVRYTGIYKGGAAGFVVRAGKPANADDAKFQSFMRRVAAQPEDSLVPPFATVFQRSLSTAEAKELADFFESPTGRKIADLAVARAQTGESGQAAAKNVSVTRGGQGGVCAVRRDPRLQEVRGPRLEPGVRQRAHDRDREDAGVRRPRAHRTGERAQVNAPGGFESAASHDAERRSCESSAAVSKASSQGVVTRWHGVTHGEPSAVRAHISGRPLHFHVERARNRHVVWTTRSASWWVHSRPQTNR